MIPETSTMRPTELAEAQRTSGEGRAVESGVLDIKGPGGGSDEGEMKGGDQSFQDQTLVEDFDIPAKMGPTPSSTQHTKSGSKSSISSHKAKDVAVTSSTNEAWDITSWNPRQGENSSQQDANATLVAGDRTSDEEGKRDSEDITDSKFLKPFKGGGRGGPAEEKDELKTSPSPLPVSRRPSALHLKPPSPQPWDLVDPPKDNMKGRGVIVDMARSPAVSRFAQTQTGRPLIPKSSYYFGPPASDSAYGTPPMGRIGVHHPREILRVERDYTGGEVIQFAPIFPLELENRLTPTQFLESINSINEILISAHSIRHAFVDNLVTALSLQLSRLFMSTHFQKELKKLQNLIEDLNVMLFNPVGLNILWPGDVAFLYLEIEYY